MKLKKKIRIVLKVILTIALVVLLAMNTIYVDSTTIYFSDIALLYIIIYILLIDFIDSVEI